ncbi:MAG TPA: hypothetical protein VF807_13730, partial [Ktedonobacterales bacterium]
MEPGWPGTQKRNTPDLRQGGAYGIPAYPKPLQSTTPQPTGDRMPEVSGLPQLFGHPPTVPALPELDELRAMRSTGPHAAQARPLTAPPIRSRPASSLPGSPESIAGVVADAPPATGTTPAVARSTPTLTQQLAAIAPPDVARQAIEELGILGRELDSLPDALAQSGLAKVHHQSYRRASIAYLSLAQHAWIALAEERLEQRGAEPEYRNAAVELARNLRTIRQDCDTALANSALPLPQRKPLFWSRRASYFRAGWQRWQPALSVPGNPTTMGRALLSLRGFTGLAAASGFELWLHDTLVLAVHVMGVLTALGLLTLMAALVMAGNGASVITAVGVLAIVMLAWAASTLLISAPQVSLRVLLGASLFSPQRTVRHARTGSGFLAGLLRAWHGFAGITGLLGVGYAIGSVVYQKGGLDAFRAQAAPDLLDRVGGLVTTAGIAGALVALLTLALVALPLALISLFRYIAELGGSVGWVPAARRYALGPAFGVLLASLAAGLVGVDALAIGSGLTHPPLLEAHVGSPDLTLSWRAVAFLATALVGWLAFIGIPFRIGMMRWQAIWLRTLDTHRAEVGSHMRRLSLADPSTGTQDTSADNLRAMEY